MQINSRITEIVSSSGLNDRSFQTKKMVVVRPGDWLWLSAPATSSFKVPIGCQVKQMIKNQVTVVDDEGRQHTFDVVKAASRKMV